MLSLDSLITPLTEDEVLEQMLSMLETLSVPARSWAVAGSFRTILRVSARIMAGFTSVTAAFVRSNFLDFSAGGWLTMLAFYVFGVTRIEATFAGGKLELVNGGGGVYSFGIGEVVARNPTTKKTYANVEAFVLNPGDDILVAFEAQELGTDSNSAPATVTEFTTTLLGVTVTNPAAIVGRDEQGDDDLRSVCRNARAAVSVRGPRGAYAYAVQTATRPDGSPVDVNRMSVVADPATGAVKVFVAAPSGAPPPSDLTYIADRIEVVARPDTVTVSVAAATEVPTSRGLTVWARRQDGVSSDDLQTLVNDALIAALEVYPIGGMAKPPASFQGYLYGDFVASVVVSAHASIYDVDGADTDLALGAGEVAVLTATIDVRIVESGGFG